MAAVGVTATARAFDRAHRLGPLPGVVAVSGGADSVALLRAFHHLGGRPLVVAHFGHGLRGAESDADAAFVGELAGRLGLPFRLGRGNLAAGPGLEAAARRQRYDWLAGVVAEVGAGWVAMGHTVDDQAETVLHRLVRGTGLHGLRGMEPCRRRVVAGVSFLLLRPLLTIARADVLAYLASLNQPYREDSSNADRRFTRNRIRHELLPLLKTFNPDAAGALNRLAEQAAEADVAMSGLARDFLHAAELPRAGDLVVLNAVALATVPVPVLRTLLRLVWEREGWPTGDMTAAHWYWAAAVASSRAGGRDFPGGVAMRLRGRVVQLGRRS